MLRKRARLLRKADSDHELALALREPDGAELGDVFAFVSSLYFRGKLAYARAFARPARGGEGIYIITQGDGLLAPETRIRAADLERLAGVPIDPDDQRYARLYSATCARWLASGKPRTWCSWGASPPTNTSSSSRRSWGEGSGFRQSSSDAAT